MGDIRDPMSINNACKGIDYIFHAAALKQVLVALSNGGSENKFLVLKTL